MQTYSNKIWCMIYLNINETFLYYQQTTHAEESGEVLVTYGKCVFMFPNKNITNLKIISASSKIN